MLEKLSLGPVRAHVALARDETIALGDETELEREIRGRLLQLIERAVRGARGRRLGAAVSANPLDEHDRRAIQLRLDLLEVLVAPEVDHVHEEHGRTIRRRLEPDPCDLETASAGVLRDAEELVTRATAGEGERGMQEEAGYSGPACRQLRAAHEIRSGGGPAEQLPVERIEQEWERGF